MTAFARSQHGAAPFVVTGGCGFIGCNLVHALVERGASVLVLDNLKRSGSQENAQWLRQQHGDKVEIKPCDVRDLAAIRPAIAAASAVFHLAAQVAVTTSIDDPLEDFDINARGTLNVLEAVRTTNPQAPLLFASTNKVYGRLLSDAEVERDGERCAPVDKELLTGIGEDAPLDFHSPYGCSKGAADQYVRDYARVFGLRTAVMRMSCIYGPRQFGTEDQGWIAHFLLQAIRQNGITIYGDGYQVRDALHVDDAIAAWLAVLDNIESVCGTAFNLGGGPDNSISLRELLHVMEMIDRSPADVRFRPSRPGDQPWFVADTSALRKAVGWSPRVRLADGLRTLDRWLTSRFASRPDPLRRVEVHA